MKKAIDVVLNTPWAIADGWLDTISSIATREHEYAGNIEALEAKLGRPLGNTMATNVRDGVAIIPIEGPLFAKATIFSQISCATSYDHLALDFTSALNDPSIKAIVAVIDSPGGSVNGASELSAMIRESRGKKPMVAYVTGQMASAAFWIGSAFDAIYAADTAQIGSVGAQIGMTIRDPKAGEKSFRFVSSQSPLKNADPGTDAGAANAQKMVDDLAQVFIDSLASNRNISSQDVLDNYGQGAVFVAAEALKRGMIDGISTFEQVFSTTSKEVNAMDFKQLTVAALTENRPDLVAAIREEAVASIDKPDLAAVRAEAATAERTRITEIMAAADGIAGAEAIVTAAIADQSKTSASVAVDLLKHVKANGAAVAAAPANPGTAHLQTLRNTESGNVMPSPSAEGEAATDIEKGRAEIEAMRKQGIIA